MTPAFLRLDHSFCIKALVHAFAEECALAVNFYASVSQAAVQFDHSSIDGGLICT